MRFSARFFALALVALAPAAALAQTTPAPDTTKPPGKPGKVLISTPEILTLVKTKATIAKMQDSMDIELAKPANKKDETHAALRASMQRQSAATLQKNGLTQATYDKQMFTVSIDSATRRVYDSVWVAVTGNPIAYQLLLARAAAGGRGGPGRGGAAPVVIPAGVGAAATHLGHVLNSFANAPNAGGLLPTAEQEAATAAQHAGLGARMPTDLDYMKTHAGHVIHALDPSQVPTLTMPGTGYGMKKAALDAGVHTDMAVKMPGVPAPIVTHGGHVQQAVNAAAARADEAVAIAKQIQAATAAADAAALYTKLVAITAQIIAGVDTNADGTIGYAAPEGGLAQARAHIDLLLGAAGGDKR
jgi:hypothetical protein